MELPNGGVKNELFTLSVENYRDFKDYLNQKFPLQSVQWPVQQKRCFYVAKGALPELVTNS